MLYAILPGSLVVLTATPAYKCPAAPYEAAMLLKLLAENAPFAIEPGSICTRPNRGRWASQARSVEPSAR
jgi:hypothetical protein